MPPGGPRACRRTDPKPSIRSSPPAQGQFVSAGRCPAALPRTRDWAVTLEADNDRMDPLGARLLAARIRAGVSVGTRIELVEDPHDVSGLSAGDRGVVEDIDAEGMVHVTWDRGVVAEIDPEHTPFRPLAA